MGSRSQWEDKTSVLSRLDPSRRAEAEARAASRANRPVNEAIKVPEKTKPVSTQTFPDSKLLGTGAAARAARAMKKGTTGSIE